MSSSTSGSETDVSGFDSPLYVPEVSDASELARAEREQDEEYGSQRRTDLGLRRLELENTRLDKEIETNDIRERSEMSTRHVLAKFLIFLIVPLWLVGILAIVILSGTKFLVLTDDVIKYLIVANPIGIGGLAVIVMKHYFPAKKDK